MGLNNRDTFVRTFSQDMLPVVEVRSIGPELHASAMLPLLTANRRKLSLVDCANFLAMRAGGIRRAFAFDQHYREQGFEMEQAVRGFAADRSTRYRNFRATGRRRSACRRA